MKDQTLIDLDNKRTENAEKILELRQKLLEAKEQDQQRRRLDEA